MPNYTLHYFNGRGRAEIIRMMFSVAGVKFMDKRYEFSDWERCRNDFPCMWLPCLEMDGGMRMPETMSICRHLAREFNFYPKSNMDMFRCDYICDCFYEIMDDYMRYYHWKNGRFRYNYMDSGMMGSNMSSGMGMRSNQTSGMMGSNQSSGMMGSNQSSGMMGSNQSSGMMGSNQSSGMMGSNQSSGMMGSNQSSGMMGSNQSSGMMGSNQNTRMMGSNQSSGMMGSNMNSGMMGSNQSSGMMESNMSSGMMGSNMNSGMGMGGSDMMNSNYDNYMQWRYMNSFNRIMPFMERTLSMRNGGNNFFMGDQMLWCDMLFYCFMENMYMENQSMFSSYPRLMALYNRVAGHPKVSVYLKNRRNTNW